MNKNKKILIVEDSKTTAAVIKQKLKEARFQVKVSNNGEEAIAALTSEDFDLIILDIIMPVMDGFEVLKWLKNSNSTAKIVVASSLSDKEDLKKAKELGASNFFMKSNTTIATIVEYVENILYSS